jgi:hypothetical protein
MPKRVRFAEPLALPHTVCSLQTANVTRRMPVAPVSKRAQCILVVRKRNGWFRYGRRCSTLTEARVRGSQSAGESPTLANVNLQPVLYWGSLTNLTKGIPWVNTTSVRPSVTHNQRLTHLSVGVLSKKLSSKGKLYANRISHSLAQINLYP